MFTDRPGTDAPPAREDCGRSQKIHPRHLDRLAVVYIRQSSMAQVHRHQESTKLQWSGGHETRTRRRRPVGRLTQMEGHEKLIAEIHALRRAGYTAERIAEKLNADGWVTPMQRNTFNARLILAMMERHGFVPRGPLAPPTEDPNDWRLADLG